MLEVLKFPDPRLKKVSTPVESFDDSLHQLLDEMAETMYVQKGIGLAAPQVGHAIRLFIIDIGGSEPDEAKLHEFINPSFREGKGTIIFEEGCLSVPGYSAEVKRSESIFIDYQDRQGNQQTMELNGLLAVCAQHENDHLDGILFIDRLSALKRQLLKRKIAKMGYQT